MEGYSQYFTFEDLTKSERHPDLVPQNRIDAEQFKDSGARLSMLLEKIRHLLGDKPIIVNSGFRNEALNEAVGSTAKSSSHLRFEAADVVHSVLSIEEAFDALMKAKKDGELPNLRKVLQEGTWLHIEVGADEDDYRGFFISHDGNRTWERVDC
jgi:hypothetical protein